MKQLRASCYVLLCIAATSCMRHNNNVDISYNETDDYYLMRAEFNRAKSRAVERYIDREFGPGSNVSLSSTRIDATISLDDHTRFYMKKSPGSLHIKLNKDDNSRTAYLRVKKICEGVKGVVLGEQQ
ncbi:hypothetical protein EXU57_14115 [Segetibacter sp. 3557_3]|uniref:hypothetical protein n=1 Tax=Segetibacter sp. 3557_3 TaxID=2547429 RepID=UPI0010591589|nr:hypothetical protein [Segetibacter sp. 3557_3]TDH25236.1 hypothetical protein EXU57_14115 [Segetibacter sp. 3557_3]